jgi:hypothetical protein
MSYFRIPSGSPLVLNFLLEDGNATKHPLAYIYNDLMTQMPGSPVPLSYVGQGLYSNGAVNMPDGRYVVVMVVYDDVGHTIPSTRYGRSSDTFDVNDIIDVQAIAEAVWKLARAGNQPAGSFGEFVDASISSRESDSAAGIRALALSSAIGAIASDTLLLPAIQSDTQTLTGRLTAPRAIKLDNLDVAVSSRATDVDIASVVWDAPVSGHNNPGTFGERVDVPISTRSSQITVSALPTESSIASAVWEEPQAIHSTAGTFGNNLDAQVSAVETEANANSRSNAEIAAISFINNKLGVPSGASVSADISAIKTQENAIETKLDGVKTNTDQLTFTAGNVNAKANIVADKTGYALSTVSEDSVVNKIWDEPNDDHLAVGSVGESLNMAATGASPGSVAAAVWNEARASHVVVGSFGEALDAKVTSRATQADLAIIGAGLSAVETKVDQVINQTDAPATANAVWDCAKSAHIVSGSF